MKPLPHNHFLHFSRKERRGIVVLLLATVLLSFAPQLYHFIFPPPDFEVTDFSRELVLLDQAEADSNDYAYPKKFTSRVNKYERTADAPRIRKLFYFDPNTLPADEWKQFGLPDKTINTIENYRNKGGKFRQPGDLRKIWGMPAAIADTLLPYVSIAKPDLFETSRKPFQKQPYKKNEAILINKADSANWEQLPGIGPVLARRIVQFREKLGGFYNIEQVAETFGLPDSTFQKIKPLLKLSERTALQKINVNTAGKELLQQHPYIRYKLAALIIAYRDQHGAFKAIEDVKKIMLINDDLFNKISPYLTVD